MKHSIRIPLAALLAWAALGAVRPASADKVHLRDGRTVEGTVTEENGDSVTVQLKFGEVTFSRDSVVTVEYELTPEQAFLKAVERARSAQGCLAAATEALEAGLAKSKVERAYEKALQLDPSNEDAHRALGHALVDGQWLTSDEAKRALGWVEYDGELMPPEKIRERQRENRRKARRAADANRDAYLAELKGVPWGAAHRIETAHYIIQCNSSKAVAQRYADFMEKIYAAYDRVFKGYKRHFTGKSTIYIFRSVKDFQEYGDGRPGVGGFYRAESRNENLYPSRVVSAFHGTFGTTGDTRLVLAHEGTHQFQHLLCAGTANDWHRRPAWWIEGLAVYFGDGYTFDEKGNLEIGIPRDRLMSLQGYLRANDPMPISEFVRLPYRQFSMIAGLSYPYSWSLTHYFLHRGEQVTGRGRRKRTVQRPVTIGGRKVELAKVFERFFKFVLADPPDSLARTGSGDYYGDKLEELLGFPIDELTEDWKRYVLDMELERLGRVTKGGEKFISTKLAFEIGKPETGAWAWRPEDIQGREAIRIENPETTGLIIVTAMGNMDNASLDELRYDAERGAAVKLESIYIYGKNEIEVGGYPAVQFEYEGQESPPLNATREVKVRSNEQQYTHIVVSSLKRSYEIVLQADKDRFKDNEEAFAAVLERFRITD